MKHDTAKEKTAEVKKCPAHGVPFEESQGALRCPVGSCVHFIDLEGAATAGAPEKESKSDDTKEKAEAKEGEKREGFFSKK